MSLTDKINKTLITGVLGISLLAGCSEGNSQGREKVDIPRKIHKNCYGMHIKENSSEITLEFYREGRLVFQDKVDSYISIQMTNSQITYEHNGVKKNYELQLRGDSK